MVQMFPTCLDDALEHLSFLEKHPDLSDSLFPNENTRLFQAELRFFRMFLWCVRDCDVNLLADFNSLATSIARLHGTIWFALTEVEEELRSKCHAQMSKYRQHLILCSLKAEPFTSDETIGFLDSVNDLLKYYAQEEESLNLEETVFLLRNFVYYTPMSGENSYLSLSDSDVNPQTNLIFQFDVHDWANKAATFLLLRWQIERGHEETGEDFRRLCVDLQHKVDPCNPEFINQCFQNIKVPTMKREDRILFGEFVSRFVDFFLQNLILISNDDDDVRIVVRDGLIFLITFLADPPANHSELSSVRQQIYDVLDQASHTICFFGEANMDLDRGKTILDVLQKSIAEVRLKIENLYVQFPHSPAWSDFPRIDRLGYFKCLIEHLENLKETMNENKKFVPFLKHQIFSLKEELLPLRFFLQGTSTMQNEDICEQIMSQVYEADFAVKSCFFIDDAVWYNLARVSFVVRNIKDIRHKVRDIEFETQTESILPSTSSIDVPKPPTSASIVGFKKEIDLLIGDLLWGRAQLDIISIVGMGGIGKTTLAKKLYNDQTIKNHFHKQAFCSASQVYRKRNVLLDILSDLFSNDDEIRQMSDDDLAHRVYKSLKGTRYLIVVDDIGDIRVWDDLRASFPDDSTRSRIILTTRINSISLIVKPDSTPCQLPFLSDDKSWELLRQKIFHTDPCPPRLLKVGKSIAKNCKGVPLAIVVIASLLARTERSLLQWNEVADTLSSFASTEGSNDVTGDFPQVPDLITFHALYIPPGEDGDEILRRLTNVQKLSCICSGWCDPHLECNQLPKLEILTKLESLRMAHIGEAQHPFMFSFPSTIRQLSLRKFYLPWDEFSAIIEKLPCLEVLVLDDDSFTGGSWNVEDEEFPNVKSLTLCGLNIEEWNASNDSFPSLEKLVVSSCSKLIEIPPCFSDVPILKYIKVESCGKSVADSAIQIQKDQIDWGNKSFEVAIKP